MICECCGEPIPEKRAKLIRAGEVPQTCIPCQEGRDKEDQERLEQRRLSRVEAGMVNTNALVVCPDYDSTREHFAARQGL